MRFFVLAVSGLCSVLGVSAAPPGFSDDAPCRTEDLNNCGSDFLIYSKDTQLPLQAQMMQDRCKKEISAAMCTRAFTDKCSTGIVRGVNLLSMQNVIDELEGKCTVGSPKHVEYMQHVPCLNKAGQDIHRCVVKYLEDIRSIAEFIPKKDKAGFNCCRHYQFEDCVRKAVDTKCKNAAAKKYLDGILESTTGEIVDVACRRFRPNSDKCKKEFPRLKLRKVDSKGGSINLLVPITTIIHSAVA